jgi:hypothetical protein
MTVAGTMALRHVHSVAVLGEQRAVTALDVLADRSGKRSGRRARYRVCAAVGRDEQGVVTTARAGSP